MSDLVDRLKEALADRYDIEREIGQGGMATVFLAADIRHERQVAIKVLHPDLAASVGHDRFLREIQILAKLNHPNIVGLIDSGEADGLVYYVMPFVKGESLRDRLRRESQLPIDDAVLITREVADALHYAHGLDIVHRDIKPENIMFLAGHAVVTDFGIARAVTEAGGDQLTQTGLSVGTPYYMSPEQAMGGETIDARSDLYSLGCVLYEMVGGEPPYTGPSSQAILSRHSQAEIPQVSIIRAQTPPHVEAVIEKALAKSPADRFRTAEHMREALSAPDVLEEAKPTRRIRRKALNVAVSIALLAAGVVLARMFVGGGSGSIDEMTDNGIVILPFAERGEFEQPLDGKAVSIHLSTLLGTADRYRPVQMRLVHLEAEGCAALETVCANQIATKFQARFYVTGKLNEIPGDSVEIEATIEDRTGLVTNIAEIRVRGGRSELVALMDSVAIRLWVASTGVADEILRVAMQTAKIDAVPHFLAGEEYFGRWELDSAEMAFQRALEIDGSLAMAWYRWAIIEDWNNLPFNAGQSADSAMAHSDRLTPRHQRGLIAHRAMIQGDADSAEKMYRQLVDENENDFEAWAQLGYLLWAYNPRRGRSMSEAVEPLNRALALAPHPQAFNYLAWALVAVPGSGDRVFAQLDSLTNAQAEDNPFGLQMGNAVLAARANDSTALALALDSMSAMGHMDAGFGPLIAAPALLYLGTLHDYVPDLRLLAEYFLSRSDSAYLYSVMPPAPWRDLQVRRFRGNGFRSAADAEAGRGRWTVARSLLDEWAEMDAQLPEQAGRIPSPALAALLAVTPQPGPLPFDPDSLRTELDLWAGYDARGHWSDRNWRLRRHIQLYLHGLLSAIESDYAAALAYADELQALESPVVESSISQDLAEGIRAEVYLRQGRPAEALAALERAPRLAHVSEGWKSAFVSGSREAFLRARALHELGQYDQALDWYTYPLEAASMALLAPSHYYRGHIFEAQADTAQAIWHYEAFTELWKDADPEYQAKVRDVLKHIAELKGETLDVSTGGGI